MLLALILVCALAQDDLQGSPDQKLQVRLSRAWEHAGPDPSLLADAKSSSALGTRYLALLLQVRETLQRGQGHDATYQKIVGLSGSGAADHLRALAVSFKAAVYCKECKDGKVVCTQCQGKKRTEVKCLVCEGKGRVGARYVDKTAVTMKCRNCDGKAVFRDVRCPAAPGRASTTARAAWGRPGMTAPAA